MSYGFSFLEILVNEITMILACIVFIIGVGTLVFCRKRLLATAKTILATGLIFITFYLMFIVWLVIGFGSH